MATLRGEPVDRPAVSFMELNGLDEDIGNPDPFNIYFDPSWKELIELTRNSTDRIVMRTIPPGFEDKGTECDRQLVGVPLNPLDAISKTEVSYDANGSRLTKKTIKAGSRTLMSVNRQDKDIYSLWTLEHLLKSAEDVKALLTLDFTPPTGAPDVSVVLETEEALGDTGIVMIDTPDPLCLAASLFDMGTFTILAWSKPDLFHELLARFAAYLHPFTEAVAKALPGRLWRIYGPEYASPPYLSPDHFKEYVVRYDQPMVAAIQQYGGFARLHSHGNLKTRPYCLHGGGCFGPHRAARAGRRCRTRIRQKTLWQKHGFIRQFGGARHRKTADGPFCLKSRSGYRAGNGRQWTRICIDALLLPQWPNSTAASLGQL